MVRYWFIVAPADLLRTAMKTAIPIAFLVFWDRSPVSEAIASSCASASSYRHSEDIGVVAVVVFELTFRDVERQVFLTDLVIRADNRPLEDRPKAFNCLRMHRTDNILLGAVFHELVRIFAKALVGDLFVTREQANFGRYRLTNEALHVDCRQSAKHASNDATFALDCADDRRLKQASPVLATLSAFDPVFVIALATDESFIDLDNSHQLAKFFVLQRRADAMADVPCSFVRAEAHMPLYLHGANALLCAEHQVDNLEPVAQIDLGILENGADKVREAVSAALTAIRALPLKFHGLERISLHRAAARAMDALRPAVCDQVVVASLLIGKQLVEAVRRQGVWSFGHLASPILRGN